METSAHHCLVSAITRNIFIVADSTGLNVVLKPTRTYKSLVNGLAEWIIKRNNDLQNRRQKKRNWEKSSSTNAKSPRVIWQKNMIVQVDDFLRALELLFVFRFGSLVDRLCPNFHFSMNCEKENVISIFINLSGTCLLQTSPERRMQNFSFQFANL